MELSFSTSVNRSFLFPYQSLSLPTVLGLPVPPHLELGRFFYLASKHIRSTYRVELVRPYLDTMHTRRNVAGFGTGSAMDENAAAGSKPSDLGGNKGGLGGAGKKGLGGVQTRRGLRDITNKVEDTGGLADGGSKGGKKPGARVASASVASVESGSGKSALTTVASVANAGAFGKSQIGQRDAFGTTATAPDKPVSSVSSSAPSRPIRTATRTPTDIDQRDADEPLAVTEYVEDLYEFLREREIATQVDRRYMDNQPHVNERMRAILIDWLVEVHLKFKLVPDTLYLTVYLIDKFLESEEVS